MKAFDFNQPVSSEVLNETMFKKFGTKVNFEKYTREQLENYRNLLRTKVNQSETSAGFNELLSNEGYQKDKFMLNLLNTRIKEMLGEAKELVAEKAKSKAQQKFMGMVYAAKKGKKPASKEVAKAAKGMSKKAAKDFAKTKHKGLPDKVDEVANPLEIARARSLAARAKASQQSGAAMMTGDDKPARNSSLAAIRNRGAEARAKASQQSGAAMRTTTTDRNVPPVSTKESTTMKNKKSKPDFLDLDNDGNTTEPMKHAAKQANESKKSKPDFLDLDKDGNTHEPMKAAAKTVAKKGNPFAKGKKKPVTGDPIKADPFAKGKAPKKAKATGSKNPFAKGKKKPAKTVKEGRAMQYRMIIEGLKRYIAEDEEGKAKDITAGADMVNDFTSWMQRIGQYQTKSMIELADSIRANFGQAEAETFKTTIQPALQSALDTLTASRETITKAVAVLAGEEQEEVPMGAEIPAAPEAEAGAPDTMNTPPVEDEFGASDAAVGGAETAGRETRESREYARLRKLNEQHMLMRKLAG